MTTLKNWFSRGAEFIAATMLAAMFVTFLLQIFSRYVLVTPFGWTLELCLILWVWIVFFGNSFLVRERDHVTFDIFYLAAPRRLRQILALASAAAIVAAMIWSFLPTWDYIDWMKIRKTTTVVNPVTDSKIPMRTIFSIYAIFMIAVAMRYAWRFVDVLRKGPPDSDHEIPGHEAEPPALRHGDDVV
jgi:C4-dicarboxylate transporter DctQ subunit